SKRKLSFRAYRKHPAKAIQGANLIPDKITSTKLIRISKLLRSDGSRSPRSRGRTWWSGRNNNWNVILLQAHLRATKRIQCFGMCSQIERKTLLQHLSPRCGATLKCGGGIGQLSNF